MSNENGEEIPLVNIPSTSDCTIQVTEREKNPFIASFLINDSSLVQDDTLWNAILEKDTTTIRLEVNNENLNLSRPGNTSLIQLAALLGLEEILKLLLNSNKRNNDNKEINNTILINNFNDLKYNAVMLSAKCRNKDCFKLLLENGGDLSLANEKNVPVTQMIFDYLPNATDVIIKVLNESIKYETKGNKFTLDFRMLTGSHEDKPQMNVISNINRYANTEQKSKIFEHLLIAHFLKEKWSKLYLFYYFLIFSFAFNLVVLTINVKIMVYILRGCTECQIYLKVTRIILLITSSTLFLYMVSQWCLAPQTLRRVESWLSIICLTLSWIFAYKSLDEKCYHPVPATPNWTVHIASISILLSWTEMMLLIGKLPALGYFTFMFQIVLKQAIKVMLVFICLIIGFSLSFSVQFYDDKEFDNPWKAFVKTTVMMMAEFEYEDLFDETGISPTRLPASSRIMFLCFVFLCSIVLINLMIGLSVSDIHELRQKSKSVKAQTLADFLIHIENLLFSRLINEKSGLFGFVPNSWDKLIKSIRSIDTELEIDGTDKNAPKLANLTAGSVKEWESFCRC